MLQQKALPDCLVKPLWRWERFHSVTTNKGSRSDRSSLSDLHINKGSVTGLLREFNNALVVYSFPIISFLKLGKTLHLNVIVPKPTLLTFSWRELILSWCMFCLLAVSARLADVPIPHHASCRAKSLWSTTNSTPWSRGSISHSSLTYMQETLFFGCQLACACCLRNKIILFPH